MNYYEWALNVFILISIAGVTAFDVMVGEFVFSYLPFLANSNLDFFYRNVLFANAIITHMQIIMEIDWIKINNTIYPGCWFNGLFVSTPQIPITIKLCIDELLFLTCYAQTRQQQHQLQQQSPQAMFGEFAFNNYWLFLVTPCGMYLRFVTPFHLLIFQWNTIFIKYWWKLHIEIISAFMAYYFC